MSVQSLCELSSRLVQQDESVWSACVSLLQAQVLQECLDCTSSNDKTDNESFENERDFNERLRKYNKHFDELYREAQLKLIKKAVSAGEPALAIVAIEA